jgi:beta-xylosidase
MIISNPNKQSIPSAVRDPNIHLVGDRYYMVGTTREFWEGYNPGVRMWSSDDLLNWTDEGIVVSSDPIPDDAWCKNRFWAPELFVYQGHYYITVSCKNEKNDTPFGMFIAYSDCITGPYILKSYEPFQPDGIDAHLYEDDDGTVWFFYGNWDIYIARFDMEKLEPAEKPRLIVKRGEAGQWDSVGVEGPSIVKRNGVYYLWYSSWTRGYEMGWATAQDLRGEFKKWPDNPVISGLDSELPCAGHNSVFALKDGRDAISFHAHKHGEEERLCIDLVSYPMESRAPAKSIEI